MNKLLGAVVKWRQQRAMRRFRKNMAFFGCDLSHLTDEQILSGMNGVARLVAETDITAQEAAESFSNLWRR